MKPSSWRQARLWSALLVLTGGVRAGVILPAVISDHMVLQAGKVVPIWGEAAPGEHVIVSFAGQRVTAVAAADGRWKANLARLTPSVTPAELTVEGNNVVRVQDVLVGEVWLGSGQSNMALRV